MMQSNIEIPEEIQFVNRRAELNLVQDIMEDLLQKRNMLKRIVNFHGVKGIGKTWLLCKLAKQHHQQPQIFVNFMKIDKEAGCSTQQVAIMRCMFEQIQNFVPSIGSQVQNLREDLPDKITATLRESAFQLTQQSPMLLLFDATEQADHKILAWLEEEMIAPLLQTNKVAIALAGRKPVNWGKFEVNRRVILHQLEPFDLTNVGEQLPSYASLASQIASLTFGHPLANEQLAQNLHQIEQQENITINQEYFEHHKKQLLQYLIEQLIDNQIMAEVDEDVRQAIKVIAIIRQFDINALRYFLSHFAPSRFKDKPSKYFLDLIGKMVDSGLVEWNSKQKGYALDTSIRRIMFLYQYHSETEAFMKMNEAAAELYALWIERLPENRVRSIIERLFHIANMLSAQQEESKTIAFRLSSELQKYLEQYYRKAELGLGGIMGLREELRADKEFWELVPFESKRLDDLINTYVRIREEG